jgi:hypothetical protein
MTRLERIKENFLLASTSMMLIKPLEALSVQRVLVQSGLRLGVKLEDVKRNTSTSRWPRQLGDRVQPQRR